MKPFPLNYSHQQVISQSQYQQFKNQTLQYPAQSQISWRQIQQNQQPQHQSQISQYYKLEKQQPSLFGVQCNSYQNQNQIQYIDDHDEIDQLQMTRNQNQQAYDLEKNLSFEIRSLYQQAKLSDSRPQYLPGMISVKTKEVETGKNKQSRVGVDLVCIIDKSGSMLWDGKMEMVKQTLNMLLEFLSEKDRLQLITFDHRAERLTPLKKMNDKNKQYLKNVISKIQASGDNDMAAATAIAFQQLKQRKQRNNVTSIFILSDGVDPTEYFIRQQMTDMNEVLTIHTFGFGADHDAEMMTNICNLGKGSFYFVQNIHLLNDFFADALGSIISVVGTEIQIEVLCSSSTPFQDIHLAQTYSQLWVPVSQKRKYKINIPQISSGSRKDFVFDIFLPQFNQKIDPQQRNATLVEAKIIVKNPMNGYVIIKNASLVVPFYSQNEYPQNQDQDIDVAVQYFRVKATQKMEEAKKKCDQNKNEEAEKIIDSMIVAIKNNQKVAALSTGILSDLQQAKQGSSRQSYNLFGQQQMCQLVSNNYNQSGTNAIFSSNGQQIQQVQASVYQNQCSYNMMKQVQQKKI